MMASILLLNGPNLNLLGTREPDVYGKTTLADIEKKIEGLAKSRGHQLESFQSNAEAELVDRVQNSAGKIDFVLINPGALTHTSIALRDALLGVDIPFIEIHISNVHAREEFRHHSFFSDIATGIVAGLGPQGYELALQAADEFLRNQSA